MLTLLKLIRPHRWHRIGSIHPRLVYPLKLVSDDSLDKQWVSLAVNSSCIWLITTVFNWKCEKGFSL